MMFLTCINKTLSLVYQNGRSKYNFKMFTIVKRASLDSSGIFFWNCSRMTYFSNITLTWSINQNN